MIGGGDKDSQLAATLAASLGSVLGTTPALVVVVDDVVVHHILPEAGQVSIGRSNHCDLVVDHPSISRQHAILHVGEGYTIEDLASANGVQVRGKRLALGEKAPLEVGEVADLGATVLMIRCVGDTHLLSHNRFETRLEDACAAGRAFGLVRVHCMGDTAPAAVQGLLRDLLPEADLGLYGPGEFEILLEDADASQCQTAVVEMQAKLRAGGVQARIGLAEYPRDGQTSYALLFMANRATRVQAMLTDGDDRPVAQSSALRELHETMQKVALGSISVLLLGETGVGKEVAARALHYLSPRSAHPHLAINCASLSESLLESALFGHEEDTGSSRPGLLESADGGTLFLDEVGELPSAVQVKLLRVLEERQVMRLGGRRHRPIDVRFVAATHRDLEQEARKGSFSEALLYRLNGVTLRIPPLRDRVEDIQPLALRFAESSAAEQGRDIPSFSAQAMSALLTYAWPGNIRELRNVVERAVLLADQRIDMEHLPEKMQGEDTSTWQATASDREMPVEKRAILDALAKCGGNQTRAAKLLGISRRTLTRRLSEFEIARPLKDHE